MGGYYDEDMRSIAEFDGCFCVCLGSCPALSSAVGVVTITRLSTSYWIMWDSAIIDRPRSVAHTKLAFMFDLNTNTISQVGNNLPEPPTMLNGGMRVHRMGYLAACAARAV